MKYLLVTGSSGTVGTRVCEFLIKHKRPFIPIDCKRNRWNQQISRQTIIADLRKSQLSRIQSLKGKKIDAIIHLAAYARVPYSVKEPTQARDNMVILQNMLEFARLNGIKRFIFISSKDVYGNYKTVLSEDDVRLPSCESPYAASKIGGEALVRAYHKCYGMDFLIFRIGNVYGMYDEPDRLIPIFIRRSRKGEGLFVNGRDKIQDYIYIDDVAKGIQLGYRKFNKMKNEAYNVGFGKGVRLLTMARLVKKQLKSKSKITIRETLPGDVVKTVLDIRKIKAFGFEPTVGIEEGLKRSIQWWSLYED